MSNKSVRVSFLISWLLAFIAFPGFGQAVFIVGSSHPIAADIGQTELAGSITLTVHSGTTVDAPLLIVYPGQITNNAAPEISITGTGGLVGIASVPLLDRLNNSIQINVPMGGTAGDKIQISGVRISVVGIDPSQMQARIYSPLPTGNSILAGQDSPIVFGNVKEPFSIDESAAPLAYSDATATTPNTHIVLSELYQTAFTSNVGFAGQTVPTRIRIVPFPQLPAGVKITYAPSAFSIGTGAEFTTLSGAAETVPRADGSTDVTYEFNATAGSPIAIETFEFGISLTQVPGLGSGSFRFQAELVPVGLAIPNLQFPSTAIPRYAERLVPDEIDLMTGTTELIFPFRKESDGTYTGVAITNPQNYRVRAILTAYDDKGVMITGENITNPATIILPRRGQYAKLASQIFGDGFNPSSPGSIRVIGQTTQLEGFYIIGDISGPKFDGSTGDIHVLGTWYLPVVFHQGSSPFNMMEIINIGETEATVNLSLRDANGNLVEAAAPHIAPGGMLLRDIREIFGTDLDSFQGGYIKGESDKALVVHGIFGNTLESNILEAQSPTSTTSFHISHFASGGQYSTELVITNIHPTRKASITMTLLDDSGNPYPVSGNPASIEIMPNTQFMNTVAGIFPGLGPDLLTGSVRVETVPFFVGGILSTPGFVGAVRFSAVDGSASAAIPLYLPPSADFVYSHVAQDLGYFTGVAIMNTQIAPTAFTLDVYSQEGDLIGSYTSSLEPSERFAKLLYELVPASVGQVGGYIRVTSDLSLTSLSLFGTDDLRSLSAIPPQRLH